MNNNKVLFRIPLPGRPDAEGCTRKVIETQRTPGIIGPYVQDVGLGSMVLTSGQIPVCPQTGEIPVNVQGQARLSFENIRTIAVVAGLSVDDIIKVTVFITNLNGFATVNKVYKQFFDEHQTTYSTRSYVQVVCSPKNVKLEIEAIAVRNA